MSAAEALAQWMTTPALRARTEVHDQAELEWLMHALTLEQAGRAQAAAFIARIVLEESRNPVL